MKKKKLAIPFVIAAASAVVLVASCSGGGDSSSSSSDVASSSGSTSSSVVDSSTGGDSSSGVESSSSSSSTPAVVADANGIYDLSAATFDEKADILGALEGYAVDNMLTGLPLYQTDSYVMYNSRITKGTESYIPGYGFGIMMNGSIDESVGVGEDNYPTYYHTYTSSDPSSIAYWDSDNSLVSSLNSYVSASYFGTKMNSTKTGYDWYGYLSKFDRPFLVRNAGTASETVTYGGYLDLSETGDTWRVYVRTGESGGVAYRTNSSLETRQAYDGVYATLDDYVSAFKILLNGKYGYYRGNELAEDDGGSSISGAGDYYNATADVDPWSDEAEAAWEEFDGVTSGTDSTGDYIQIKLGAAVNRFYSMYYLTSTFYEPVPMDFFKLVTNDGVNYDNFGNNASDLSTRIIDNVLSVGPFYLQAWNDGVEIVYARNDNWWEIKEDSDLYSIDGYYVDVLPAAAESETAAFEQFLAGNLDSCTIPSSYLAEYLNDPRTSQVPGDGVWKLNINTCDQELWNDLFGDNGSVAIQGDNAWKCKPWMSNDSFIKGLFYSIDRNTLAQSRGYGATINYFSDDYLINPEDGISWNSTEEHEAALQNFWGDTIETAGYSLTASASEFNSAISELMSSGDVSTGDTLTIDVWWMATSQSTLANEVASYIENSFNSCSAALANSLTLDVVNNYVASSLDVYYDHLMVGMFDLGFGSITGNSLDPLNFMEVLKSDNSSSFTLNWGADTSAIGVEYDVDPDDGVIERWSFDTLWAAADHGVVLFNGVSLPPFVLSYSADEDYVVHEDGSVTFTAHYEDAYTKLCEMNTTESLALAEQVLEQYTVTPAYFIATDYYSRQYNYYTYYGGPAYAGTANFGAVLQGAYDGVSLTVTEDEICEQDENYVKGSVSVTFTKETLVASGSLGGYVSLYLYGVAGLNSTSTAYVDFDFVVSADGTTDGSYAVYLAGGCATSFSAIEAVA